MEHLVRRVSQLGLWLVLVVGDETLSCHANPVRLREMRDHDIDLRVEYASEQVGLFGNEVEGCECLAVAGDAGVDGGQEVVAPPLGESRRVELPVGQ